MIGIVRRKAICFFQSKKKPLCNTLQLSRSKAIYLLLEHALISNKGKHSNSSFSFVKHCFFQYMQGFNTYYLNQSFYDSKVLLPFMKLGDFSHILLFLKKKVIVVHQSYFKNYSISSINSKINECTTNFYVRKQSKVKKQLTFHLKIKGKL